MKNTLIAVAVIALLAIGGWYYYSSTNLVTPTNTAGLNDQTAQGKMPADTDTTSPLFTLAQVVEHNSRTSCYTAIRGFVYDLTDWIGQHPGGEREILQLCGKDGTDKFVNQHGGMPQQENMLATFKIGRLAQ